MTAAIWRTPRSSSTILWILDTLVSSDGVYNNEIFTHFTSSLMVVSGKSGPYLPLDGSPSLYVTALALPYGLPRLLRQMTKNRVVSKAWPGPPRRGPHQSLTSALPLRAWQITKALLPSGDSFPLVV